MEHYHSINMLDHMNEKLDVSMPLKRRPCFVGRNEVVCAPAAESAEQLHGPLSHTKIMQKQFSREHVYCFNSTDQLMASLHFSEDSIQIFVSYNIPVAICITTRHIRFRFLSDPARAAIICFGAVGIVSAANNN